MKKVLLVDDEVLVREGIRNRIEWEHEGFIYCGDAPDGEIALPLIESLSPDILLTDVKMPFMDGLQLSRIVKEKMPWIKIIILSGHDEFGFAREALRIGVEEYCLKPINAAELVQVLAKVSAKIDQERKELKDKEQLQLKASVNHEAVKEQLLIDLCLGSIPTAGAIHTSENLGIALIAKYYLVLLAEIPGEYESHPLFQQMLCDLAADHLHMKRNKKEHVWILKGDDPELLEQCAQGFVRRLKQIEEQLSCTFYLGKGSVRERVQEIAVSFSEAEQNKSYHYFLRNRPIVSVDKGGIAGYDRNQVPNFLKVGDFSKMESFVAGYIHDYSENKTESKFHWHYLILDMIAAVTAFIHESKGDVQAFLSEMESVEEALLVSNSLEEVQAYARSVLSLALKHRDRITDKYGELLSKARDYIDKNFDNPDISLQSVAAYVNVSPSHFSGIFSQGVGQTFIDYLIKTRIKKAMELLKTTNAKSYEIAAMVGYSDPHYFNSVFKKVAGVTTKVFRNQA